MGKEKKFRKTFTKLSNQLTEKQKNKRASCHYLGRVTVTGAAAIAGILQLMSGLISKRISLLKSTVWSLTDNNFFWSWRRKHIIGTASSSVARNTWKNCVRVEPKANENYIKESKSCTSDAWKRIVQLHYENLTLYWVSATEKKDVRLTNQKRKKKC